MIPVGFPSASAGGRVQRDAAFGIGTAEIVRHHVALRHRVPGEAPTKPDATMPQRVFRIATLFTMA